MNLQHLLTTVLGGFEQETADTPVNVGLIRSADMPGGASDFFYFTNDVDIDPSDLHADGDYTITGWIRPTGLDSPSNNRGIVSKGSDVSNAATFEWGIEVNYTFDRVQYWHSDGTTVTQLDSANSSLTNETWHFISITFDGSTGILSLAIDNGTPVTVGSVSAMQTLVTDFRTGDLPTTGTDPFLGQIAAIGVWYRILSGAEVTAIYNSGLGKQFDNLTVGEAVDLLAYIDLDELSTGVAEVNRTTDGATNISLEDDQHLSSNVSIPGS